MPTLEQLARKAKTEIKSGDNASSNADMAYVRAEECYYRAGKALQAAKDHPDMGHGQWLPYLKKHDIAERTARQHMALASGKLTLKQIREAARERMRLSREVAKSAEKADCSADLPKTIPSTAVHRVEKIAAPFTRGAGHTITLAPPETKTINLKITHEKSAPPVMVTLPKAKPLPLVIADSKTREARIDLAVEVNQLVRNLNELNPYKIRPEHPAWPKAIEGIGGPAVLLGIITRLQAVYDRHCPPATIVDTEASEATKH